MGVKEPPLSLNPRARERMRSHRPKEIVDKERRLEREKRKKEVKIERKTKVVFPSDCKKQR